MESRKAEYLKTLKIDYHVFNEIVSILEDEIDNRTKANLIIDVLKQEIDKVIEDAYEEGYYWGEEDAKQDIDMLAENDYLRECLKSIQYIMSDVEF